MTNTARHFEVGLVVPCFNEARRLDVRAYSEFLGAHSGVAIIFVDDGSTDDTPLVLERLRQQHAGQVCTLRLDANSGKAEAVRRGMQAAQRRAAEFVGYWDADLATPLDAIPRFVNVLRERPELQLVMGSRARLLGRRIRRSARRHVMGRVFATAASLVLGLPVYDTQCGAKLFRATAAATLFARPFRTRWIFDVELLARMMVANGESVQASPQEPSQGTLTPALSRRERENSVADVIYEYPLERWEDVAGSRLQSHDVVTAALDLVGVYWEYMRGAETQAMGRGGLTGPPIDSNRKAA